MSSTAETLSAEQVRWVAHLARLELTPAELETMTAQLGRILGYVAQLRAVDTKGVEPLAHALETTNVFRPDEPGVSLPADEALANAPRRVQNFFGVPAVLD
jgi:aspartyl-tRNA(Asn)/glutamyl-tRNA(Gln) amidotransferase subunit C